MGEILLIALGTFIILNVPIAFSIGGAALLAIYLQGRIPLFIVVQKLFTGMDSFPLLAIPLFMIAGILMERGGISARRIMLAKNCVGNIYGGLGIVTILASMFFSAISGSAPATVVAIGSIMIPAMIKDGYDKRFAVGLMAAAGTTGFVIPPSIPLVTYGITMNASIGKLFAGGIVPGILMGCAMMLVCYVVSRRHGYKSKDFVKLEPGKALKEASWGILMPVIILGGIYGGFFTPTEAAAVAAFYGLLVGLFVYRELTWRSLWSCCLESARTSAIIIMLMAMATIFGNVMTLEQVPERIASAILSFTENKIAILLLINLLLLWVGTFMEALAAIVILTPILLPLVLKVGVDPIHFGVIMVVNLAIGFVTPPVGVNLFVASGITKVKIEQVSRAAVPFLIAMLVVLGFVTFVPEISLFLID